MSEQRRRQLERAARTRQEAAERREGEVQESPPEPQRRSPIPFIHYESWIDQQIRQAQERGDFDNLRGKGQPLAPDDQNAQAFAGDDAMGLKLLKNNDALPAWIELNKEIAAERLACQRVLDYYTAERDRARRARYATDYRRLVSSLNEKIDQYNLIVPSKSVEQIRVRADLELRDADERRWSRLEGK